MTAALEEILKPVILYCKPMRVKVKSKKVKEKYYVHFDGSKTYDNPEDWNRYWISYETYVRDLLKFARLDESQLALKNPTYAVAMVGTLFDFLAKDHS